VIDSISVLLTVYNQEDIIQRVFHGITKNISSNVKEIIVIIDGCTDNTKEILMEEFKIIQNEQKVKIIWRETPNLNETLANNVGLKLSSCDYTIIVQDDCAIQEPYFDLRMLTPFKFVPNLLAVSGRDAVDIKLKNGQIEYYNVAGTDVSTPRNIFSIRDAINRSPLMLDNKKLKELNYLDEAFAPLNADDVDLCIRAYKKFGYLCGSYVINYHSPLDWGTTRKNPISYKIQAIAINKNLKLILERHRDFITGEKHSKNIEIM